MAQTSGQMHHLQQQQQGSFPQHVAAQSNGGQRDGVQWGGPFPSLHLWPIQETFTMKMIHLPEGQRIKIGRQTNNKTVPGERNAYFDSKVLSRTHAEIWEQNDKIYIKDLKSSNGTFVNNERLSPEGLESEPYELKTEDIVEFGIDIVGEDNRTIVHHKVAAKVYCVFGEEDAALSSREVVHYHDGRNIRRPAAPSQGSGPQGGPMAPAVMSSGGKTSGLSFDHVLNKLQLELQKSKEAGAELQNLSAAMNDIQDTLGGGLPPAQNGSAAQYIPHQYRSMSAEAQAALTGPHGQQAAAFISLQNQLGETQSSLSAHLDKIHHLESRLTDHESLREELSTLREQMENGRREVDDFLSSLRDRQSRGDEEDDDAKSVVTLMDNEDAEERVRQRRQAENGDESLRHDESLSPKSASDNDVRLQSMSAELAEAVQTSKTLQMQQLELLSTVRQLTQRIGVIEDGIAGKIAEEINKAEKRWDAWRAECESGWKRERESWEAERERLRGVVREWEEASRRGHEEVEERELNERLNENDYEDQDEDAEGEPDEAELLVMGPGWKDEAVSATSKPGSVPSRKIRRRRPSHRTALAVRALKSVADDAGTSTPKADAAILGAEDSPPDAVNARLRFRNLRTGRNRGSNSRLGAARNESSGTLRIEKDSSESGRDSGDTLKESGVESKRSKKRAQQQSPLQQPIPIFTVIMVAVVAGALYYRHKD